MLTVWGSRAVNDIAKNRATIAEALAIAEVEAKKHNSYLTESDYKAIKSMKEKMEVKTMKKATRKVIGNGNNARIANITSVEYAKNIKVKKLTKSTDGKTAKVSDCKVFKLYKDDVIFTFEKISDGVIVITSNKGFSKAYQIELARKHWKDAIAKGYKKVDENPEKKPAKPCKSKASKAKKPSKKQTKKQTKETKKAETKKQTKTAKKTEVYPLYILEHTDGAVCTFIIKNRGAVVTLADGTMMSTDKETARKMYKALTKTGYKRVA